MAVDTVEKSNATAAAKASCRSCATGCDAIPDSIFRLPLLLRRLAPLRRCSWPPRRRRSRTLHGRRTLNAGRPLQSGHAEPVRQSRSCQRRGRLRRHMGCCGCPTRGGGPGCGGRSDRGGCPARGGSPGCAGNRGVTVVRSAAARRVDWASRVAAAGPRAAVCPAVAADRVGSIDPAVAAGRDD